MLTIQAVLHAKSTFNKQLVCLDKLLMSAEEISSPLSTPRSATSQSPPGRGECRSSVVQLGHAQLAIQATKAAATKKKKPVQIELPRWVQMQIDATRGQRRRLPFKVCTGQLVEHTAPSAPFKIQPLPPRPYIVPTAKERLAAEGKAKKDAYEADASACFDELHSLAKGGDSAASHEGMVQSLAAMVGIGKKVTPSHIEAAVQRELGIDVTGRLHVLIDPITKSYAIYEAARERMRQANTGYEALLALRNKRDLTLCQESDDFETVYRQAIGAQELLKSKVASRWQTSPVKETLSVRRQRLPLCLC